MVDIDSLLIEILNVMEMLIPFFICLFVVKFCISFLFSLIRGDSDVDVKENKKKVDLTKHKKPKSSETDYSNYIGFHHNNIAK